MKVPPKARKVTQISEIGQIETGIYFVEFLPLRITNPIAAQSFDFSKRNWKIFMLTTNLKD